jgi:hypothetical protein
MTEKKRLKYLKERKGKERKGKERKGKERKGNYNFHTVSLFLIVKQYRYKRGDKYINTHR